MSAGRHIICSYAERFVNLSRFKYGDEWMDCFVDWSRAGGRCGRKFHEVYLSWSGVVFFPLDDFESSGSNRIAVREACCGSALVCGAGKLCGSCALQVGLDDSEIYGRSGQHTPNSASTI